MYKYKIKSAKGWWKAKGLGYTQNEQEAGIFTVDELPNHNLDLCTLYRVWEQQLFGSYSTSVLTTLCCAKLLVAIKL